MEHVNQIFWSQKGGGVFKKVSLNQTFYGMFRATTEPLFYGHFMSKGFSHERIVNTMFLKGTIMYYY